MEYKHTLSKTPIYTLILLVVLGIYYFFSIFSAIAQIFPVNQLTLWTFLLRPEDVVRVTSAPYMEQRPKKWLTVVQSLHKENADVLFSLSTYLQSHEDTSRYPTLLRKANTLDPYNEQYRNALIDFFIKNHLYTDLGKDLIDRGFEGVEDRWTPNLYAIGLDLVRHDRASEAEPYWHVASMISPSSSHMWIEYANLLSFLQKKQRAQAVLERCASDYYAGKHCAAALKGLVDYPPLPIGVYKNIILLDDGVDL